MKHEPAFPFTVTGHDDQGKFIIENSGLTKRELAGIELLIAETGNEDIDELIKKAKRSRFAAMAIQGQFYNQIAKQSMDKRVKRAVAYADALIKALEASDE